MNLASYRLHIRNLHHQYGKHEVLRGIDLTVTHGEIVCLAGPSGCGKSTLLRLIAGLEETQRGEIMIDGQTVSTVRYHTPPERRHVGLVFQDFALFPHMTIAENVGFGVPADSSQPKRQTVETLLKQVGLTEYANRSPHVLSGGQQQRVALARALASQPKLLLLDEPFSNLDVRLRQRMRLETQRLIKDAGVSSILVTHDPQEAMLVADRIALMHEGEILQVGTPAEIYDSPATAFATEFFGDVNRFECAVINGEMQTPFGSFPYKTGGDARVVELLVRPEAVSLSEGHAEFSVCAKALQSRTLGAMSLIRFALSSAKEGLSEIEIQALLPNDKAVTPGSTVHLQVDTAGVFAFPMRRPTDPQS